MGHKLKNVSSDKTACNACVSLVNWTATYMIFMPKCLDRTDLKVHFMTWEKPLGS